MPTFDAPHPITANVEIAAGSIRLVATDRGDTVVDVRPRDESRPHDVKAAEQTRIDFNNGTLAVTSRRGFALPRRGAVIVDIELPTGSRLHASVASAGVTADGEYAECKLASASGDFAIGTVTGNIKADTVSGAITIATAKASGLFATASGDVKIGELEGDVKFRTASGALAIGQLHGDLNAQTSSGDVSVASAVNGHISVHTSSGEVSVGVPEGTAAQLDLITGSGTVRNTLQPSDGPAAEDETVVVHSRTGSGDVIVHRASGPAAAYAGSKRNTLSRSASASNSSGAPVRTRPARFAKPTPTGTLTANVRSTGPASASLSSTIFTGRDFRPRASVPVPAARALAAQSLPGYPATT